MLWRVSLADSNLSEVTGMNLVPAWRLSKIIFKADYCVCKMLKNND
jgi:hypothetical protein